MSEEPASMVLDMLADTIEALNEGDSGDATIIEHLCKAVEADCAVSIYYDQGEAVETIAMVPNPQAAQLLADHVRAHVKALDGRHFTVSEVPGLGHVVYVLIRPHPDAGPIEGFGRIIALARSFPYDEEAHRVLHRACRPLTVLWPRTAMAYAKQRAADEALSITDRERQVLELLARGMLATSIASRLDLSPRTVHKHLGNIYRKLGVHDRLVAVSIARANGLLPEAGPVPRR